MTASDSKIFKSVRIDIPEKVSNPDSVAAISPVMVDDTILPLAANASIPDSDTPSDPATITEPDALAESLPLSVTAKLPDIAPGGLPKYSSQLID